MLATLRHCLLQLARRYLLLRRPGRAVAILQRAARVAPPAAAPRAPAMLGAPARLEGDRDAAERGTMLLPLTLTLTLTRTLTLTLTLTRTLTLTLTRTRTLTLTRHDAAAARGRVQCGGACRRGGAARALGGARRGGRYREM